MTTTADNNNTPRVDTTTQLQNANQMIAHLSGVIDVLHELVNKDTDVRERMYQITRLVRRTHKHQEQWFERLARGERVVQ